MKTILICRHAKSDWGAPFERDHDRSLAPRGRSAARSVGRFLQAMRQPPELIVSSTATRAHTTALLAAEAGGWECEIRTTPDLYDCSVDGAIDCIAEHAGEVERIMVFGHQPTWSGLVARLTGGSAVRMPTAAVARVDLHLPDAYQLARARGELVWLVTPKVLERGDLSGDAHETAASN